MSNSEKTDIQQRLTQQLNKDIEQLDTTIITRLKKGRQNALTSSSPTLLGWLNGLSLGHQMMAFIAACFAIVTVAHVMLYPPAEFNQIDSFEMMVADEQLEFYEHLEFYEQLGFYEWLADEAPTIPVNGTSNKPS